MNTIKNYTTIHLIDMLKVVLSNIVCVPNKTEDLNLSMFNIITRKNNQKQKNKIYHANVNVNLMEENVIQIKIGILINVISNNIYEKDYILNPSTCSCKNENCLASIVDNSVITCDGIIEKETKTVTTNFNEKYVICKIKKSYILLTFLLITIALLTAVGIYCYVKKI